MTTGSRWIITVLLTVLTASVVIIVMFFSVGTSLGIFLPQGKSEIDRILLQQLSSGSTSNLVFISLSGTGPDELAGANLELAGRLSDSGNFSAVRNSAASISEGDRELIFKHRYLLSQRDFSSVMTEQGLKSALADRLEGLMSAMAPLEKQFLRDDPTGETLALYERMRRTASVSEDGPVTYRGVWLSRDRLRTLMIVEMDTDGFDMDGQGEAVTSIYENFEATRAGYAGLEMVISGPGVFVVETGDVIRADVKRLSLIAIALVGGFLLLAFRSAAMLFLVFVPLLAGVLVGTAAVLLVFGSIHGVTMAFGVTISGVAVDYPIHLFSHLDRDRSRVRQYAAKIWPTLRLGVLSTLIAYAAFVVSGFEGIQQLGVFTLAGLTTAAAVTRWLLPEIVPRRLPVRPGLHGVHRAMAALGRRSARLGVPAALVVVAALASLTLTDRPIRDLDVNSLSPISDARRADDRAIREDLGYWSGGRMLVVTGDDPESVLRASESLFPELDRLQAQGAIGGYRAVAQLLPSMATQQARLDAIPPAGVLAARIAAAQEELPFKPGTFDPFLEDIEQVHEAPLLGWDDVRRSGFSNELSALLFRSDGMWVAPVLLFDVADNAALQKLERKSRHGNIHYLYLKGESTRIVSEAIDQTMGLLVWGLLAIYAVLGIGLRDLFRPIRILVPTIAAVITASAILVGAGIPLTVFHLVSLLLVIGLGLDYALFFNRLTDNEDEWNTTFRALWVCCFTTVLVFGMLMISRTPPLNAIGITVALGAFFCLVYGAIWTARATPPDR